VLHVPPEVKRLDEIKIGDMVSITETTTALIELQTGRDAGSMGAEGDTEVEPRRALRQARRLHHRHPDPVRQDRRHRQGRRHRDIKGAETTRTFPVEDKALLDELKVGDGVVAKFKNVISGEVTVK
jgi:hypothetical protein